VTAWQPRLLPDFLDAEPLRTIAPCETPHNNYKYHNHYYNYYYNYYYNHYRHANMWQFSGQSTKSEHLEVGLHLKGWMHI